MFKWVQHTRDSNAQHSCIGPFLYRGDLVAATKVYLAFLTETRGLRLQLSHDVKSLRAALMRYEHLWLPLLSQQKPNAVGSLVPPQDVHFIWLLHILTGDKYATYCQRRFRRVFKHIFKSQLQEGRDRSEVLWDVQYPIQPFNLQASASGPVSYLEGTMSSVLTAMQLASEQWLLPHFMDNRFLGQAAGRYCRFMELLRRNKEKKLVPAFDIQLLWWVHCMQTESYQADITEYLGVYRPPVLEVCLDDEVWEHTEALYQQNHGEYQLPATRLYPPPLDKLTGSLIGEYTRNIAEKLCNITIDKIVVSQLHKTIKHISIEARHLGHPSTLPKQLFVVEGHACRDINIDQSCEGKCVTIDLLRHRGIELQVTGESGMCCFRTKLNVAALFFDPRALFGDNIVNAIETSVILPRMYSTDPKVVLWCRGQLEKKLAKYEFHLEPGVFFSTSALVDEHKAFLEQLELWSGTDWQNSHHFRQATHRLRLVGQELRMECCIGCSKLNALAVVSLYHPESGPLTLAYTIGEDILPAAEQVCPDFPLPISTFAGDAAMAICNQHGLWGVVIVRPRYGQGTNDVQVIFHEVGTFESVTSQYSIGRQTGLSLGPLTLDLESGHCWLVPGCTKLAEYLTLALCLGCLFVRVNEANPVAARSGYMALFNRIPSLTQLENDEDRECSSAPASLRSQSSRPGHANHQRQALQGLWLQACGVRNPDQSGTLFRDRDPVVTTQLNQPSWNLKVKRTFSDTDSVSSVSSQKRGILKGGSRGHNGKQSQRSLAFAETQNARSRKLVKRVSIISNDSLKLDKMDSFINAAFAPLDEYDALEAEMNRIDENDFDRAISDMAQSKKSFDDTVLLLPSSKDQKRGKYLPKVSKRGSNRRHPNDRPNDKTDDLPGNNKKSSATESQPTSNLGEPGDRAVALGHGGSAVHTESLVMTEAQVHYTPTSKQSEENDDDFWVRL